MNLSTRLTLAMVGLVLLTATTVGYLTYRNVAALALPRGLERIDGRARLIATELEALFTAARADAVGSGAAVAAQGIVRSRLAGGIDPMDGTSEAAWRDRMAAGFAAELAAKPSYRAFSIVALADGREIMRVDRSGPDGSIRTVPDGALTHIRDEILLQETRRLSAGDSYITPITLGRRNGVIVVPHVPALRVASPLQAPDGSPFGALIISVDLRDAFARIRATARDGVQVYVINNDGDYLVHPDPERTFGFALGRPFRVQDDFPDLAALLRDRDTTPRVLLDRSGAAFGVAWQALQVAQGPRIAVVESIPYPVLMAAITAVRNSSLFGGLLAVLGGVALAVLIARSLARPLVQMTTAVEGFGRGECVAVPTEAGGEVGKLAQAFARMAAESREKTAALLDSERLARGIVETALDAFIQMDESGIIREWNAQAQKVFGWARDEAIGKAMSDLIVPERYRSRHQDGFARYLRTGEDTVLGKRMEIEALRRDGTEITVELTVTALRRREDIVFNGFLRDITERIAAGERTRQAQKMEAVGQLVGGIAHDFNNMLTVITGTIDILAEGVADRPQLHSIAKLIGEAADRGAELTGHLLAFARKQPLQPRDTDVNDLVGAAQSLFRRALGEQIEIDAALADDAWFALVDPTQLTTALLNLALNARDAMPSGGKLTLETKNVVLDQTYAGENPELEPDDYVMIAVSDTGTGIPQGIRDRVFEPFFSTKAAGKGTGLGLSMVYGFVKQSRGYIKLYSEEGHGTTIRIYLPRSGSGSNHSAASSAGAEIEGGSETILIVEDDALVRGYVASRLRNLGYRTLEAANAAEAIAVTETGAAFDLLFTDLIMTGAMNGRELAVEIAKRRPAVKVLFTSGYAENANVHHGRLDPGELLLTKPYRNSELGRMIRRALIGNEGVASGQRPETEHVRDGRSDVG
ncbi:MAG TPA: PAS domain S-box protein [Xanthobacteraceae bacterium]|nr:PAS domain S-box protein [Xanthobacteraceae bacterium]